MLGHGIIHPPNISFYPYVMMDTGKRKKNIFKTNGSNESNMSYVKIVTNTTICTPPNNEIQCRISGVLEELYSIPNQLKP